MCRGTLLVVVAAFLLTGCLTGRWRYTRERPSGKAETLVKVVTDPPDAEVTVNGRYVANSPFTMRLRYPYRIRLYERRNWFPYPRMEEREVPVYHRNVFEFSAAKVGYQTGKETITTGGEAKAEVKIRLRPR